VRRWSLSICGLGCRCRFYALAVLLDAAVADQVVRTILATVSRSTFPVRVVGPTNTVTAGPLLGTAFLFNELVESLPDVDRVREYLLTADVLTRADVGEFQIRAELTEPAGMASDVLVMPRFSDRWQHRPDLGVAVMSTDGLHEHARRKGWSWVTQEVTDGLAARVDTIARIGAEPATAFVLGHPVGHPVGRNRGPAEVATGQVSLVDGDLRFVGDLVDGYVGGPVFIIEPLGSGAAAVKCLGLLLPGRSWHPLATFDRIRDMIATLGQ
jgi:hypothetical protein